MLSFARSRYGGVLLICARSLVRVWIRKCIFVFSTCNCLRPGSPLMSCRPFLRFVFRDLQRRYCALVRCLVRVSTWRANNDDVCCIRIPRARCDCTHVLGWLDRTGLEVARRDEYVVRGTRRRNKPTSEPERGNGGGVQRYCCCYETRTCRMIR